MLERVQVIEIGQVLSAPYAATIFADLGADVIKVEKPELGDDARHMGAAFAQGDSLHFLDMNRNKASVTIDLKSAEGVEQLHDLLETADILIHNMRPGVVDTLGIDGPALCARHPRLIYCEISGFGNGGPMKKLPAFEPVAQAFSGILSINGNADGPPARLGVSVVDMGTAMWTVIGALSALHQREITGKGGIINTSLLETSLAWAGPHIAGYLNEGRVPQRLGTAHPHLVPYQTFDANDGSLLIAAGNDRLFERLCGALGTPEWKTDPRFKGNRARITSRVELIRLIAEKIATQPRQFWIKTLTESGVPCAPVNTIPEVLKEPQVEALGILQKVADTGVTLAGLPLSFNGQRPKIRKLGPRLGQDNATRIKKKTPVKS
ncbi:CaiB/BaiF CoA transferase family protein [Rhodoplanes sp. Z2-YC6860]|uniref:CaiB/BaiF CoA transferase family protein n=1 Tax=Rhodoplanes sp. Z2-YC6860 TaxID=674703 RepID=UPI00078D8828|nr:CoA transferase [Rhodoplanes sp. Z2-YC6860]AMN39874.1 L-carnitine dehydratase/bile acid-inducible protein F [Rhodoplanes sp. Z2-YC6860]